MDGAVVLDDYELALQMLEDGFRSDEAEWHAMAVNKIKAHIALKEGRVEDAIARFRDFVKNVESWESATTDPTTGIKYTREMTLGRNARRIGELYASIDKQAEAMAAFAEARGYLEEALAQVKPDSREHALIAAELESIPESGQEEEQDAP